MNYFSKYRYAIWTIIILIVIIVTAVITGFIYNQQYCRMIRQQKDHHHIGRMLHNQLGLSAEQDLKFRAIHKDFFKKSHLIFDSLEADRIQLIKELSKSDPDTVLLFKISDDMGLLHARLKRETVKHLLKLRSLCTPEQVQKLINFNKELIPPERSMRKKGHGRMNPKSH